LIEKIRETGDLHTYIVAQKSDPCKGFLGKFSVFTPIEPDLPDATSVSVCIRSSSEQGSEKSRPTLLLKIDFSAIKELDPETLEPTGIAYQKSLHPLLKRKPVMRTFDD
jgi:torulene dioxygenase